MRRGAAPNDHKPRFENLLQLARHLKCSTVREVRGMMKERTHERHYHQISFSPIAAKTRGNSLNSADVRHHGQCLEDAQFNHESQVTSHAHEGSATQP